MAMLSYTSGLVTILLAILAPCCFADVITWTPNELPQAVETLKKSTDPRILEKEAIWIAVSGEPQAIQTVGRYLIDMDFLNRLTPPKQVDDRLNYLRTFRILRAIAQNGGADAEAVFLQLGSSNTFAADRLREWALVEAAGYLPYPSTKFLVFLDSHPTAPRFSVMKALARISTDFSTALAEKRFMGAQDDGTRLSYCQSLTWGRNSFPGVRLYQRLIASEYKNPEVKNRLVQTLFDYRDAQWFKGISAIHVQPEPPARQAASTEVLQQLLKYADQVQKMKLSEETQQGIKTARKEIQEILASREGEK